MIQVKSCAESSLGRLSNCLAINGVRLLVTFSMGTLTKKSLLFFLPKENIHMMVTLSQANHIDMVMTSLAILMIAQSPKPPVTTCIECQ